MGTTLDFKIELNKKDSDLLVFLFWFPLFAFSSIPDHVMFVSNSVVYLSLMSGSCSLGLIDQCGSDSMKPIRAIASILVVFCS